MIVRKTELIYGCYCNKYESVNPNQRIDIKAILIYSLRVFPKLHRFIWLMVYNPKPFQSLYVDNTNVAKCLIIQKVQKLIKRIKWSILYSNNEEEFLKIVYDSMDVVSDYY